MRLVLHRLPPALALLLAACGSDGVSPRDRGSRDVTLAGTYRLTDSVSTTLGPNRTWLPASGGTFELTNDGQFTWTAPTQPTHRAGHWSVFDSDSLNATLLLVDTVNAHGWFALKGPQVAFVDNLGRTVDLLVRFPDGTSDYAFTKSVR